MRRSRWSCPFFVLGALILTSVDADAARYASNGNGAYDVIIWDDVGDVRTANSDCPTTSACLTSTFESLGHPNPNQLRLLFTTGGPDLPFDRLRLVISLPAGSVASDYCNAYAGTECTNVTDYAATVGNWAGDTPEGDGILILLPFSPPGAVANGQVIQLTAESLALLSSLTPALRQQVRFGLDAQPGTLAPRPPYTIELVSTVPTIEITAPTEEDTFTTQSLTIALGGTASDRDGTIASVTWTSDRGFNGTAVLGAGTSWLATAVPLLMGANVLTVTAQDNQGTQSTDTLTVTVTAVAPTVSITSPSANPAYTATSLFVTLSGTAADTDGTVTSVTWVSDRGPAGTASIGTAGATVTWIADSVYLGGGPNTITVTATDNTGAQSTDTIVVTVNELSYYLAEGATGGFFDLDLLIANPNTLPVTVTATFLRPSGGSAITRQYTLEAYTRMTIDVEQIPGLEEASVSTIVQAPAHQPIIVERTMRWGNGGYGAHTDKASPNASNRWYFAEGSQGFFQTFLLLANPMPVANQATVTYLREGQAPLIRVYALQPLQRFTVDASADPGLQNTSFGMEVNFTLPGIAERAMYFGLNPLWFGGHESMGVTDPSREWFLAEGATGPYFETFVLFANPGTTPANVHVRFLPGSGQPVDKDYTIGPQARLTVNIEAEHPTLSNAAVATQVSSDVPILVERAQYWPDPFSQWYEAHNSFGVTKLGASWGLAEGRVGGAAGYQTYILLANVEPTPVNVTIRFMREAGPPVVKQFTINPTSRLNVAVGSADVPEITEGTFGAAIEASKPIAVERAMYSNANGQIWQAGTNATATRLP